MTPCLLFKWKGEKIGHFCRSETPAAVGNRCVCVRVCACERAFARVCVRAAVMCSYHSRGARGGGAWRERSWRVAEKALLGENDRPVPKTPLYTKHLKDSTGFITGQHESCSTHTGNWPPSPLLCMPLSLARTAFCLNWRTARKEG